MLDGPIFFKSRVELLGGWIAEFGDWTDFSVYDGPNTSSTGEVAVIVIDGVKDASVCDRLLITSLVLHS